MKKLLAVMLSVIMLATPILACAATPGELLDRAWEAGRGQNVTVSVRINQDLLQKTGDDELALVGEVLNAASFSVVTAENGPWKAALNLSDNEVLNIIGESDGEMSYLGSTLLGDDVLAANDEEKLTIANYLIDLMVKEGVFTTSDATELKLLVLMTPALMEEMSAAPEVNPEDVSTEAIETLVAAWDARLEQLPDPVQPAECDPVAHAYTITLTGDDLLALYDAAMETLKSVPEFMEGVAAGSEQDPEKVLAQLHYELKTELDKNPLEIPLTIMTDANDELVYASASIQMANMVTSVNGKEKTMQDVPVLVVYNRLTGENGKTHTVTMLAEDGEETTAALLEIDVDNVLDQRIAYNILMLDEGEVETSALIEWASEKEQTDATAIEDGHIVFTTTEYDDDEQYETGFRVDYSVDAEYDGQDAYCETEIVLLVDNQRIGTLMIETESCDPLPTLVNGDVVRVGQLIAQSDVNDANSPINQYFATLEAPAMQNLIEIMQNLPMSVLLQLLDILE